MIKTIKYDYYRLPREKIETGDKVIIYGWGNVGKQYYTQIVSEGICEVSHIIDKRYSSFNPHESIENPEDILINFGDSNEKIIIASSNESRIIEKEEILVSHGVNKANIIYPIKGQTIELIRGGTQSGNIYKTLDEEKALRGTGWVKKTLEIYKYLYIFKVDSQMVRIGSKNDGGYVMIDDFETYSKDKIAYSFGISNDVSWDLDMVKKGFTIFMYDHTIKKLPMLHEKFHWTPKGIAGLDNESCPDLDTLENFMKENSHLDKDKLILKMDVEGAEYDFIHMTNVLSQFSQMVFEFHGFLNPDYQDKIIDSLKKINKTHKLVHIHANNYCYIEYIDSLIFPDTYELTFARRESYEFKNGDEVELPLKIDMPCNPRGKEIIVKKWNCYVDSVISYLE